MRVVYDNDEIKRRKEEGVFYTPNYIADFICKNTIIPYLSKGGVANLNDLILENIEDIGKLESKLKHIKILDPACGYGVFLIKAVDLLFEIAKEIRLVKDLGVHYEKIKGKKLTTRKHIRFNLDKRVDDEQSRKIIENNIYGVDINESSIEKTKFSLYSKIARKDRKSMDLSQNIKCGDSLIEDENLRGDKAFIWSQNFKDILNKGGFDIIIGNPPYINIIEDLERRRYYKKRYSEVYTGKNDIYYYFFQKAIELSNKNGYITFISPRYLMEAFKARKLREYILKETAIQKIIDFSDFKIFKDANIDTAIYSFQKTRKKNKIIVYKLSKKFKPPLKLEPPFFKRYCVKQNLLTGKKWYFIDTKIQALLDKIEYKSTGKLKDYSLISKGIQTGKDSVFIITKGEVEKYSIEKENLRDWLKNSQISRFGSIDPQLYVIMSNRKTIKELSNFPNLEKYFLKHKEEVMNRARVSTWFHWRKGDERFTIDWKKPKIITPYKSVHNNFTIDNKGCYFSQDIVLIIPTEEIDICYLLGYLNSKLCEFYFKIKGKRLGAVYEYYPRQIEDLPFIATENVEVVVQKVDRLLDLNKQLASIQKTKLKTSLNDLLKEEINQTEEELDLLFYTLFDLKEEEISLIRKQFS
ncbi:MAG: Eco57I restriction-modification methylase domain-containing protein [Candidatus Heimdallarchaeota archaeon]|nr:MAG: Eco57I restriction-modification methylase domain-containing protein [Candidatus Heimdallarchaeota archaeon]